MTMSQSMYFTLSNITKLNSLKLNIARYRYSAGLRLLPLSLVMEVKLFF